MTASFWAKLSDPSQALPFLNFGFWLGARSSAPMKHLIEASNDLTAAWQARLLASIFAVAWRHRSVVLLLLKLATSGLLELDRKYLLQLGSATHAGLA